MATEPSGTSGARPANTGKADNYVPVFSNQQREYKEFKKRAEIYRVKMRLAGRQKETVFNLVTMRPPCCGDGEGRELRKDI